MDFEPIREDAEDEEEYGETVEHESGHNTGSVPDLPSGVGDVTVEGKSTLRR